jgi:hypothetical protein
MKRKKEPRVRVVDQMFARTPDGKVSETDYDIAMDGQSVTIRSGLKHIDWFRIGFATGTTNARQTRSSRGPKSNAQRQRGTKLMPRFTIRLVQGEQKLNGKPCDVLADEDAGFVTFIDSPALSRHELAQRALDFGLRLGRRRT